MDPSTRRLYIRQIISDSYFLYLHKMASSFLLESTGIASSVFLALYVLCTILLLFIITRLGWTAFKSTYGALGFYCLVRLGSFACGIAYAKIGSNSQHPLLIPYLVLSMVGFVALLVTALAYVVKGQVRILGRSWISRVNFRRDHPSRSLPILGLFVKKVESAQQLYRLLVLAGIILSIVGVSRMDFDDPSMSPSDTRPLRSAGLIIQFVSTVILIAMSLYVFLVEHVRTHHTVTVICSSPFFLVRGIYGVLSAYLSKMNFLNLANYTNATARTNMTIYEYVLETSMEFIIFLCLVSNFFFEEHSIEKVDEEKEVSSQE